MEDKNSSQAEISRAAIRTMEKDLAGVVFEEWEEILAESEILNILSNFKSIKTPKDLGLEEERLEALKQKELAEDEEKRRAEEERIAREKREEKERLAQEEERKKKEEEKRAARAEEAEEETKIVAEIKRRALERERMVREKMGKEREKRDEEEELKMIALEEQKRQELLMRQKQKIETSLNNLPNERKPLDETKHYLLKEKSNVSKLLEPILESERKIEENIRLIERQESAAVIPIEKRKAEKERQILEIEREKIEQERWGYEREHFKVDEQLKELDFKYQELAQKEAKLIQELNDITKEIEKYEKRKEIKQKEKEIEGITGEKGEIVKKRDEIVAQKRETEEALAETKTEEEKIERELDYLKQEEVIVKGTDKQRVEKERWKLEGIRGELEKKKWQQEDEKRKLTLEENRFNVRYQNLLEKENALRKDIDEINKLLGLVPEKGSEEISPQKESPLKEDKKETSPKTQEGKGEKSKEPIAQEEKEEDKEKEVKEAEELLKKLEEKRRKEDLLKKLESRRKEEDQRKEEEILRRIRSGITTQTAPPDSLPKPSFPAATSQPPVIISPSLLAKKQWLKRGILILLGIVLIGAVVFVIWQIKKSKPAPPEEPTPAVDEIPSPPTSPTPPVLWQGLIVAEKEQNYKISGTDEIPALLTQVYAQNGVEKKFIRIVFENTAQNKFVGMSEFLSTIGASAPQELFKILDDNFTLYFYSENKSKSLGFIAKKKPPSALDAIINAGELPPDLRSVMSNWESSLIMSTQLLGALLGEQIIEKPTCKDNQDMRYCDLSKNCFGVCYSVFNDYLIFGTCCNSVVAAKDLLKK